MRRRSVFALGALWISGTILWGQEASPDRVVVPFRDANRPRQVRVHLINGSITVRGYAGKDVIVDTKAGERRTGRVPRQADGLRRLDVSGGNLNIEEENNVVTITSRGGGEHGGGVVVQVPTQTSLSLKTVNNGDIVVEQITGELDVDNLNGNVTLRNVAGAITAHSLNGNVNVTVDRVFPDKPQSFSTLNGDIDVTLPADLRARFRMKADNGEVFSDFDVQLEPNNARATVEDNRNTSGKFRVKVDRTTTGTVNGGGPDVRFTTFNGKIMIRKRK